MSTCCGRAGQEHASVSLGPRSLGSARSGPPTCSDPALRPWEGSPSRAHLVVSRHGPAPLQEHVLDATDGRPGCLSVPEQGRGARGCPARGGTEKPRPERWETAGGPLGEELQPQHQLSHLGLGCSRRPSGLPQTRHGSRRKPSPARAASYPPNLSTMALRFCARAPRGRAGADTLRSGAFSFFFSCGGGGSVGLWGTSLGEDSLRGKVQRHVRGSGTSQYRV